MARGLFAAILLLMAGASMAQDLKITIKPMFEGFEPYYGPAPLVAVVENPGANAEGTVSVRTSTRDYVVPVQLPSGSSQAIPLYIESATPGMEIVLSTNRDRKTARYAPESMPNQFGTVLAITDRPGEFAILRGSKSARNSSASVGDAYVLPENVGDRMVAFEPFLGVVLGSGAERISDGAVASLKRWVSGGGKIAFVGGAGSQVVRDPRWQKLMPAQITGVENRYVPEVDSTATVSVAQPSPGSTKYGKLSGLAWKKQYGAGTATVLLFDPTESPYREAGIARASLLTGARFAARSPSVQGGPMRGFPSAGASYRYFEESVDGPFTLKLPSANLIGFILLGYLIAVIPVNFGILKLIKRGEWAWFTVPLISIVFAGVLFNSAQSLYKFGQKTQNTGTILHVSGEPESIFVGDVRIFFPKGGGYAPKLDGLESVTAADTYDSPGFTVYDTGAQIEIPLLAATNLSYRQFGFTQTLRNLAMPTAIMQGDEVVVRNNSDLELKNLVLAMDDGTRPQSGVTVKPGGSATINVPKLDEARQWASFLQCTVNTEAIGPKFANDSDVSSAVTLNLYPEIVK